MNDTLNQPFYMEDIKIVVLQMALTKSPGIDGMSAIFYLIFSPIVGEEVA